MNTTTLIRQYYILTKPGIIYGNALTVIAGFVFASRGYIDYELLFVTLLGLSLIVASGCVYNNYIDRDIDARMERTKKRPLVTGTITSESTLIFGAILLILGLFLLYFFTNYITFLASIIGFVVYVFLYSLWLKRTSTHGTIIGSISGAMPILVGYLSVRGEIDIAAIILFCILAFWQMTHSFAIAIYRLHDYKNARIAVLPVKKGIKNTKIQMLIYTGLFGVATLLLPITGYTGWVYFFVMAISGCSWLLYSIKGFYVDSQEEVTWAKKMFIFSIGVLVTFCVVLIV